MSKKNRGQKSEYTPTIPTRVTPPVINNPDEFKIASAAVNIPLTMQYYGILRPLTNYIIEERDGGYKPPMNAEPHLIEMAAYRRATELFPDVKFAPALMTNAQRHFALAVNEMKDVIQRSYMSGRAPEGWNEVPNNIIFLLDQYIYSIQDMHEPICIKVRNLTGRTLKQVYERGALYTELGVKEMTQQNILNMYEMQKSATKIDINL